MVVNSGCINLCRIIWSNTNDAYKILCRDWWKSAILRCSLCVNGSVIASQRKVTIIHCRFTRRDRPSLRYNVTRSTLLILIKADCIIVNINATCKLLNLIQLMLFEFLHAGHMPNSTKRKPRRIELLTRVSKEIPLSPLKLSNFHLIF